jgi:hypothetical protein
MASPWVFRLSDLLSEAFRTPRTDNQVPFIPRLKLAILGPESTFCDLPYGPSGEMSPTLPQRFNGSLVPIQRLSDPLRAIGTFA